jgi:hypothetical protein
MADNYYTNLNNNIRSTDDVSFKLLGLVPLFSGSGILLAVLKSDLFWSPAIYAIAAFGALVTLGLFRWELRNIQTCVWLINCGRALEEAEDASRPGQYYRRPGAPMRIGKTEAEKLIYGVTVFTWLLLPWLVYSTVATKNNAAPPINATLNSIYIALALVVGIFTVVSIVRPLNVAPKPPASK